MKTTNTRLRWATPGWALALAIIVLGGVAVAATPGQNGPGVVNVNTATLEQLQRLPGIGETRSRAIVQARRENGAFRSIDELGDVHGVGRALLEKLRPFVTLEGKTTLGSR